MLHFLSLCYYPVGETLLWAPAWGGNSLLHFLPPPPGHKPTPPQERQPLPSPVIGPSFAPGLLCFPWAGEGHPHSGSTSLSQALPDADCHSPIPFRRLADKAVCAGSHLRQRCGACSSQRGLR